MGHFVARTPVGPATTCGDGGTCSSVLSDTHRIPVAHRLGHVVGVLPLVVFRSWLFGCFAVSLPFVNYGGIVADDEATACPVGRGDRHGTVRRLGHIELRHDVPQFEKLPNKKHKVAMLLPLSHPSAKRGTASIERCAIRCVRLKKAGSPSSLAAESCSRLLQSFAHNMRDLGTPVHSRRLFDEVFDQFMFAIFVVGPRSQVDGAQSAAADFANDLIRAELPANERLLPGVGKKITGNGEGWLLDEAAGLFVRSEKRFYFASENFIAAAFIVEESRALVRIEIDGGIE